MKRIKHYSVLNPLLIETPNGRILIQVGEADNLGRATDIVQVFPDNYVGENLIHLYAKPPDRILMTELKTVKYSLPEKENKPKEGK